MFDVPSFNHIFLTDLQLALKIDDGINLFILTQEQR